MVSRTRAFLCALTLVVGARAQADTRADVARTVVCTVSGHVLDEDGQAIVGAGLTFGLTHEVTVDDALERPLAATDAEGRFTLACEEARPDDVYAPQRSLLIAAPGKAAMSFSLRSFEPVPRALDLGAVVLLAGTTLHGRTRDATGASLAGVRVLAFDLLLGRLALGSSSRHVSATTSGDTGIFKLRCVPVSGLRLVFAKAGFFEVQLAPVNRFTPLDVTLQPSGFTTGRVLDANGEPCRIWLHTSYEATSESAHAVETDADGRFRLPVALPTRYRVRTYSRGLEPEILSPILSGPTTDLVLRSTTATRVATLRVVDDATGEPVSHFTVQYRAGLSHFAEEPTLLRFHLAGAPTIVGAEGVARVPLASDRPLTVMVTADGRARAARDLAAAPGEEPVEIRLASESAVVGVVRDADGKPLAGAWLCAIRVAANQSLSGSFPPDSPRSDMDGRFKVGGLRKGTYQVCVAAPGSASRKTFAIALDEFATKEVEFALPSPCRLVGRLRSGVTVPPHTIARLNVPPLSTHPGEFHLAIHRELVAPVVDGTFSFDGIDAGTYEVVLVLPRRQRVSGLERISLDQVAIKKDVEQTFAPTTEFDQVAGVVDLGEHSAHAARLVVFAEPTDSDALGLRFPPPPRDGAPVGFDGRFALAVPRGSYRLVVFDMATGLRLHEADGVKASSSKPWTCTLRVPVRRVDVRLRPAAVGTATLVDDLQIVALAGDKRAGLDFRYAMLLSRAHDGLDVQPGDTDCWFLAPPGAFTLRARSRSGFLRGGSSFDWTELGEATITVGSKDLAVDFTLNRAPSTAELQQNK